MRWAELLRKRLGFDRAREDVFTLVAGDYGGVLAESRYGGLQQAMSKVCAVTLQGLRSDEPEGDILARLFDRIALRFIENWDPNALVLPVKRHSYVGIYGGAATVVPAITFAASRSERVWTDLPGGGSHGESFAPLLTCLAGRRMIEPEVEVEVSEETLYRPPETEARHEAAQVVASLAWQFIYLHEICHVLNGHLDFMHRELGVAMLLEADESPGSRPGSPMAHAIELDADSRAISLIAELSGPMSMDPEDREGATTRLLRFQIVALGIVFELFDWESLTLQEAAKRFHPHPAVRMASALEVMTEVYCGRYGVATEPFESR